MLTYPIHAQLLGLRLKKPRIGNNKGVMVINNTNATGNREEGAKTVFHSINKANRPKKPANAKE